MTADEILATKSVEQLRAAILKGRTRIEFLEGLEGVDIEEDRDGAYPPSKAFENWTVNFTVHEKRLLLIGIRDCERELARRRVAA